MSFTNGLKINVYQKRNVIVSIRLLVLGIILMILTGAIIYLNVKSNNLAELSKTGVITQGVISDTYTRTERVSRKNSAKRTTYYVVFTFDVGNKSYSDRIKVSESTYRSVQENDEIEIIYDQENPNESFPFIEIKDREALAVYAEGNLYIEYGLLGFIMLLTIGVSILEYKKKMKRIKYGTLTEFNVFFKLINVQQAI